MASLSSTTRMRLLGFPSNSFIRLASFSQSHGGDWSTRPPVRHEAARPLWARAAAVDGIVGGRRSLEGERLPPSRSSGAAGLVDTLAVQRLDQAQKAPLRRSRRALYPGKPARGLDLEWYAPCVVSVSWCSRPREAHGFGNWRSRWS